MGKIAHEEQLMLEQIDHINNYVNSSSNKNDVGSYYHYTGDGNYELRKKINENGGGDVILGATNIEDFNDKLLIFKKGIEEIIFKFNGMT